jgi:serine/threonine protein kinase
MTEHSSVDPEFRAGDRIRTEIGDFEVQQVLGAGGMGVVYQVVRDERHGGRQFAIKTILPELLSRREVIERFEAEGRVLSKFDHENIIKIDGIFNTLSEPPRPFILMELLQGYTLRFVMDQYEEPLSVNDVCTVAIGVCNALEEIHKHNVVHRDIKPENIFIQKRRRQTRVVLIDFGIMKMVLGSAAGRAAKSFLGSYSHASPEQLLGKEVTPRSDFYSLAASLYEMLTGAALFPDLRDARAIGKAHIERRPLPLQELAPLIAPEIAEVVMRALDKDPSARPKDAHAFRQPFTLVRNRILREQAQSAGHSTIETFLASSGAAAQVSPVAIEAGNGGPLGIHPGSELGDATVPSAAPWGGTQPDRLGHPVSERGPSALTVRTLEMESESGLAAVPIQPPPAVLGGPGTDSTSTREVAARASAQSGAPGHPAPLALSRPTPRAPYLLLRISLVAAALVGGMGIGRLLQRPEGLSTGSSSVPPQAAGTADLLPPEQPLDAPLPRSAPAGSTTAMVGEVAAPVDAAASVPGASTPVEAGRSHLPWRPKPAASASAPNPFEDRK